MDADPTPAAAPSAPHPALGALAVAIGVATTIAGWIGNAVFPSLVRRHPAALLAINPADQFLLLVTNSLNAGTYYIVGFLRRGAPIMAWVFVGRWYGERALRWTEQRTGRLWTVRLVERWFAKASWPVLVAYPAPLVCVLAGSSGMPLAGVFAVSAVGQLARLGAIRGLGSAFSGPISELVRWIDRLRWPLLGALVAVIVIASALEARRRAPALDEPAND